MKSLPGTDNASWPQIESIRHTRVSSINLAAESVGNKAPELRTSGIVLPEQMRRSTCCASLIINGLHLARDVLSLEKLDSGYPFSCVGHVKAG
jgi:hypothetical protein